MRKETKIVNTFIFSSEIFTECLMSTHCVLYHIMIDLHFEKKGIQGFFVLFRSLQVSVALREEELINIQGFIIIQLLLLSVYFHLIATQSGDINKPFCFKCKNVNQFTKIVQNQDENLSHKNCSYFFQNGCSRLVDWWLVGKLFPLRAPKGQTSFLIVLVSSASSNIFCLAHHEFVSNQA